MKTLDLVDFEYYTHIQVLSSAKWDNGIKTIEFYTQYNDEKKELVTGFRVMKYFTNESAMQKISFAKTLAEAIVKFNEIK